MRHVNFNQLKYVGTRESVVVTSSHKHSQGSYSKTKLNHVLFVFLSLKKSRPSFFCVQTHTIHVSYISLHVPDFTMKKLPKCRKIWMVWERRLLDTENHVHLFLLFRYYEFCKHLGSFFERDPKIVNSVVKYSMMEIRQASCPAKWMI